MEKNDVEFFGTLLNEKPEDVEQAVTDGTLSDKVKALKLMSSVDVDTLKTNLTKEVKENHIGELVEAAKGGNIDSDLYGVIKGAVIEKTERSLAKEHKIESFKGINDLVSQAISKNKGQTDDTKMQELNTKIKDLQVANVNLVSEKDTAVKDANTKADSRVLLRDKRDIVNSVPFDFSDVDQKDLEKITGQRRQIVQSVFDARYDLVFKDEDVVVQDKEGNLVKNQATMEPITPSEVMNLIPVELGIKVKSPEGGGQGGSSSAGKGDAPFASEAEFNAYCTEKGITPISPTGQALWAKRGPK